MRTLWQNQQYYKTALVVKYKVKVNFNKVPFYPSVSKFKPTVHLIYLIYPNSFKQLSFWLHSLTTNGPKLKQKLDFLHMFREEEKLCKQWKFNTNLIGETYRMYDYLAKWSLGFGFRCQFAKAQNTETFGQCKKSLHCKTKIFLWEGGSYLDIWLSLLLIIAFCVHVFFLY